jgi:hypothetical protein
VSWLTNLSLRVHIFLAPQSSQKRRYGSVFTPKLLAIPVSPGVYRLKVSFDHSTLRQFWPFCMAGIRVWVSVIKVCRRLFGACVRLEAYLKVLPYTYDLKIGTLRPIPYFIRERFLKRISFLSTGVSTLFHRVNTILSELCLTCIAGLTRSLQKNKGFLLARMYARALLPCRVYDTLCYRSH